ncbi:MAG: DinB family protein [Mucilaginibacter sp.]|nr:DinB family protein [Mucilaginibacter sp.]
MKNALSNEITDTKNELLKALDLFDQENINTVPFEGSWTGGQVAEHVLKSASGILETIKGPAKATERNPDEHVKQLGDIFLNMDIKMKSPDLIIPSIDSKDKSSLAASLGETLDSIKNIASTDDLSATCTGFDMPMMGPLTRLEWISFASFHTKRHTQQLKNIINHLRN